MSEVLKDIVYSAACVSFLVCAIKTDTRALVLAWFVRLVKGNYLPSFILMRASLILVHRCHIACLDVAARAIFSSPAVFKREPLSIWGNFLKQWLITEISSAEGQINYLSINHEVINYQTFSAVTSFGIKLGTLTRTSISCGEIVQSKTLVFSSTLSVFDDIGIVM